LAALDLFPHTNIIITKSNADMGGTEINAIIDKYANSRDNAISVSSLGILRYLSALKHASAVIGNSSSGIIEAPYFRIPTVNIGDRQKGRVLASSVINCPPDTNSIYNAVKKAISDDFRKNLIHMQEPYGNGYASEKIVNVMQEFFKKNIKDLKKPFYSL
jgi:GDP/UDP-N,N'-diacetylbacillosamine 2-epimerase (hydrolysing)